MNFNSKDYEQEALFLLSKLISFKTVLEKFDPKSNTPFGLENKKALDFLLEYAKNDGFKVLNQDNYAGHIEFGKGKETLGILAHLDVVPVDGQNWQTDPFILTIKDDKLFGRGSVDDKGPLVCAYFAMKMLKDQGFVPNKKVRLIVGCDEESGSRCLNHYFKHNSKPEFGFSPDAEFPLIYGEKAHMNYNFICDLKDDIIEEFVCGTRYNIVPAKASMKIKIDLEKEFKQYLSENNYNGEVVDHTYIAYGKSSHAMVPQNGINASFILMDFLAKYSDSKVAKFFNKYLTFDPFGKKLGYDLYDEEMKELTSNVGLVNSKDGKLIVGMDCRVPNANHEQVMLEKINAAVNEFNYETEILSFGGFHYVDPKSFLVTTLMDAYTSVTKDYESKPMTIGGGTYAKFIDNCVAYGPLLPGREDVCHIADEYMYLEDFLNAIIIYAKAIYELTK